VRGFLLAVARDLTQPERLCYQNMVSYVCDYVGTKKIYRVSDPLAAAVDFVLFVFGQVCTLQQSSSHDAAATSVTCMHCSVSA
jgi:hypothetical protein